MSSRIEKINSLLQHELSKIILRDFDFPEVMVTLTYVDTTANLIEVKAYISVLPEDNIDKVVKVLNKGVYSIQQKINKLLNMRPVPKIIFVKDEKISQAAKVEELLETLKRGQK